MKTEKEMIDSLVTDLFKYCSMDACFQGESWGDYNSLSALYGEYTNYIEILTANKSDKIVTRFNYLIDYFFKYIGYDKNSVSAESFASLLESLLNSPEDANMENFIIYPGNKIPEYDKINGKDKIQKKSNIKAAELFGAKGFIIHPNKK